MNRGTREDVEKVESKKNRKVPLTTSQDSTLQSPEVSGSSSSEWRVVSHFIHETYTMKLKDYIIKLLLLLIWAGIVWYTIWLYLGDKQIVPAGMESVNLAALIFVIVIWLFLLALIVKESLLPNNRRGVLLLWVGIIRASHIYLADSPADMVYLRDIMKLVGVFLCIVWPMKLLTSADYAEKKFEEEMEVIEV